MISFLCCLALLVGGYFVYGAFIERVFGIEPDRVTPAYAQQDGVDYVPMPTWKVFMIQFLNIAGLGPIFGAIMGAKFGLSSFVWIVLGSIFAGATHDFLSGMLSIRNNGESLPELIGRYLGRHCKQLMRGITLLLMILVGAVFVAGPAGLLAKLTPDSLDIAFWAIVIFLYYIVATLLPIDKIIGKIYPLFAFALLFMAVGILVMMIYHYPALPEFTDGLHNTHPAGLPIFPMMFVSIACGAISGFHATQSTLMARCLKKEKYGRPVFYGAMMAEGIVALIWAAAATYFFHTEEGKALFAAASGNDNAAIVVDSITREWLGTVGGFLAVLGVVAAPITSGDTAFRSARLLVADFLKLDQKPILKRLLVSIPLFAAGFLILQIDFAVIWRYFAWVNQTLAAFTLWAITVYLATAKKRYIVTLIPALFMTTVCSTYLFIAPEGLNLSANVSQALGTCCMAITLIFFLLWRRRTVNNDGKGITTRPPRDR
ncbi:MAG: carbon starvation protein A [Tannerellaceae bacterium]|jgi:carbon starvation protein CstA|nr:carbon starvation protein A [Tannerellaceae bacterium]